MATRPDPSPTKLGITKSRSQTAHLVQGDSRIIIEDGTPTKEEAALCGCPIDRKQPFRGLDTHRVDWCGNCLSIARARGVVDS